MATDNDTLLDESAPIDDPTAKPKLLIEAIQCRNLLSFGPDSQFLRLNSLNVLIGPNGSGKSNLLEAVSLLQHAPRDIRPILSRGGGLAEWIFKGSPKSAATVEAILSNPMGSQSLRHHLSIRREAHALLIADERVENEFPDNNHAEPYFYYRHQGGAPVINTAEGSQRRLNYEKFDASVSILAQRNDPDLYPELSHLHQSYRQIRLYREWQFGRDIALRAPQKADLPNTRLSEDFSNLGLYLNRLRRIPTAKKAVIEGLQNLYEGLNDFDVSIEGGAVQVFFNEGGFVIPATRLSDGSLRYLCLLAILCDPDPPPLIGIEEPELGLHPDLLPRIADLLIDASRRTQLIVTTHSDILVDAMTERPESVVVCEKHDGQTVLRRLQSDDLAPFLEKYRLGQLWTRGQVGGTRW